MTFQLVPKSVTLNDPEMRNGQVSNVIFQCHHVSFQSLRYFNEFGKPVFQDITALICSGIYARVYCIL